MEERLKSAGDRRHGDCALHGACFPAYLLKCLRDWFDRYGEELVSPIR